MTTVEKTYDSLPESTAVRLDTGEWVSLHTVFRRKNKVTVVARAWRDGRQITVATGRGKTRGAAIMAILEKGDV